MSLLGLTSVNFHIQFLVLLTAINLITITRDLMLCLAGVKSSIDVYLFTVACFVVI